MGETTADRVVLSCNGRHVTLEGFGLHELGCSFGSRVRVSDPERVPSAFIVGNIGLGMLVSADTAAPAWIKPGKVVRITVQPPVAGDGSATPVPDDPLEADAEEKRALELKKLRLEKAKLELEGAKLKRETPLLMHEWRKPAAWVGSATALLAIVALIMQFVQSTTRLEVAQTKFDLAKAEAAQTLGQIQAQRAALTTDVANKTAEADAASKRLADRQQTADRAGGDLAGVLNRVKLSTDERDRIEESLQSLRDPDRVTFYNTGSYDIKIFIEIINDHVVGLENEHVVGLQHDLYLRAQDSASITKHGMRVPEYGAAMDVYVRRAPDDGGPDIIRRRIPLSDLIGHVVVFDGRSLSLASLLDQRLFRSTSNTTQP
jgi:hypothetical protein